MFNILQISSSTFSALRCKQCMNIIFRQDNINAFISYDSDDLGLLQQFSKHPKLQTQADYFVLNQDVTYYSSMKVNYNQSLIKNYHPFFKMHMFQLSCAQCIFPLGYVVQTVNQNTLWLQNRFLVDVKNCALIKDGKDSMGKLIKTLKIRLARKLVMEEEKNEKNQLKVKDEINKRDKQQLKKIQQRRMILRLQKIYNSMVEKSQKNKNKNKKTPNQKSKTLSIDEIQKPILKNDNIYKNNNFSSNDKKIQQSLMTTNVPSSANIMLSKQDTNPIHQSLMMSNVVKAGQDDQNLVQQNDQYVEINRSQLHLKTSFIKINELYLDKSERKPTSIIEKFQQKTGELNEGSFPNLIITHEQRQLLAKNILLIKLSIATQCEVLESKQLIQRILYLLTKLSLQEKYIYNKVPYQLNKLNILMTYIRLRFLERKNGRQG